ncbi:MAG TPA: hypothetical protein VM013_01895 [Dehalococcoidia bacterium]|nr:hypothetical protein [Dehalococcoidia bacterium]
MRRQRGVACVGAIVAVSLAAVFSSACGEGAPSYRLTVVFNTSVTQADMDEVSHILRRYDSGAEMLVTETFPPVGHATLRTGTTGFCDKIESDLDSLSSVQNVSCERLDGGSAGDG